MKKGLVLLLVMILLVGTLVACGGSDTNDANNETPPNELDIALTGDPEAITYGARAIAEKVVGVLDEFLDGHISSGEASERISALREEYDLHRDPANFTVSTRLTGIGFSLIIDRSAPIEEEMQRIRDVRNELAEFIANSPVAEEQPTPAPIEETNEPEDNELQAEVQLNLALVGTWRDDTITIFTRVFNEDGTGSRNTDEQPGGTASENPFTWRTPTDGQLILSDPRGNEEHFTYSINGDILTLTGDFAVSYIRE
jgi:hypothetical protein